MSDEHRPDDRLDRATAALRDTPVPEMPADLVERILAASKPAAKSTQRKIPMKTILRLAAAFMVGASVLVFLLVTGTPRVTFAEALTALKEIKTVQMRMKTANQIPQVGEIVREGEMIVVAPDRARTSLEGVDIVAPQGNGHAPAQVEIADWATGQELRLDQEAKTAVLVTTTDLPEKARPINFIKMLTDVDAKDAKPLGQKEIEGKKAQGFELRTGIGTTTVWINPATRLPILVETVMDTPLYGSGSVTYSDFVWNKEIDPSLVSLDPPPGYTLQKLAPASYRVTEKDLVAALKDSSDFLDGRFPDQFDAQGLSHDLGFRVGIASATNPPAEQKKLMDRSMDVQRSAGRAWVFMADPQYGTDFHYAGKGKRAGTKDPILWYRPAGSDKYRLVDASLNVTDVAADQLPKAKSQSLSVPPTTAPAVR